MNVLFICTSNKYRSPALEKYFKARYPEHSYKSGGINWYFTHKYDTHYPYQKDFDEADLVVFAEKIHYTITQEKFKPFKARTIVLRLGEYKEGHVGEDYLTAAEEMIGSILLT